ncbi:tyrosine-protein phosphatase [Amorphus sp. 3PC139-8]|uniref:tyrosine-protein phosphatase n=1 Tax=Amorphus sp. 3PC139-8 TaxID=2735676 RepID=UPI00345CE1DF
MIDLHCHLLPGLDDGSKDLAQSIEMARMAEADGIRIVACTPHITPGVYDNEGPRIRAAVEDLAAHLFELDINLYLVAGADVHIAPNLAQGFRSGRVLTLADSRYFLFEPPHHVAPPRLEEFVRDLLAVGFIPVITHPERLSWIDTHFSAIKRLFASGAWIQVTAGSITGQFGSQARYWSELMLDEGMVHIVATDAHNTSRRPPNLSAARAAVASRLGEEEAERLCQTRPLGIVKDLDPSQIAPPPALAMPAVT